MRRFDGKVVLVTAGAAGIGQAIVRRFVDEGADLAICDIEQETLAQSLSELSPANRPVLAQKVDVSDGEALEDFVAYAAAHFGRLDVLVNNAGGGAVGNVEDLSPENWRLTQALSLDSVYHSCHAAIGHLKETNGNVVNIASVAGIFGEYDVPAYSAAKAGVLNLTRAMAWNLGPEGVRVNAVSPGATASRSMEWMWKDPELRGLMEERIPLRRWAAPADIAAAVAFLASEDAAFVTGANIVVDGGMTLGTGSPRLTELAARSQRSR